MESGDPVTTAARGGWCDAINLVEVDGKPLKSIRSRFPNGNWYADANLYNGDFVIEVVEVDDETTGHKTTHTVRRDDMVIGLQWMAIKYPHSFKQVIQDNTDAPCADIFLQCTLFGEEKYA
jgi:hypothetical protein